MKQMTMIGNAHLDPVWFWRWQEGYHEVKATFRSALDRMNETPGFVFTCACADYYRWVEENAPDMFEEIRQRVAEGRWVIVGGMWIQPDMNVSSGETLARQLLLSQRFFQDRFGVTATVGYNVDSFGHNAMCPQLYKKAGINAYVWMRPGTHENPDIPEGAMIWESPDGSRIKTHRIPESYYGFLGDDLSNHINRKFAIAQRLGQPMMCFYGVGNHGGGPTISQLKAIDRYMAEDEKGGDVGYGSPVDYFRLLDELNIELPVWKTELQHHASGCYSTHSRSKHAHRAAEHALLRMEKLGALSAGLTGHAGKADFTRQAWQNVLFCEFHDAMGGCSAEDVLDDVVLMLNESRSIAAREENAALQRISWQVDTIKGLPERTRSKESDWALWGHHGQGTPVVVFNPHEFEAEGPVRIRRPIRTVRDDAGNLVPSQIIRAGRTNGEDKYDAAFTAKVPPLGYRLYWVWLEETPQPASAVTATPTSLENEKLLAEFDPATSALTKLVHKGSGLNVLRAPSAAKLMDISHCDTWAHNVFKFDTPAGEFGNAEISVREEGPVRASLCVRLTHGESRIEQIYTLYADADQLEVDIRLDLREHHRMIKLCYPTAFTDGHDVSEIPYGVLPRTANGNEQPMQRWCAMQGTQGGLAVLNDGRYSYSAQDGELRLTVANTSIYADHYGQQTRDDTCRFMDQGELHLTCILAPYAGEWQQAKLHQRAAVLNQPLPFVVETYHTGPLGGEYAGLKLDNPAVALGAFKRVEDGTGWVLRLTEATGHAQHVTVDVRLLNRKLTLNFTPFEIKTVFLPDDPSAAPRETLLTELD